MLADDRVVLAKGKGPLDGLWVFPDGVVEPSPCSRHQLDNDCLFLPRHYPKGTEDEYDEYSSGSSGSGSGRLRG